MAGGDRLAKLDSAMPARVPSVEIFDHVDGRISRDDLMRLETLAGRAVAPCIARPAADAHLPLAELHQVEVSILSDDAIADVHRQFMADPTPTDVITFHHGEILISFDTAGRCAGELGQPLLRELLLYVIHGLLHLNGHEDYEATDRRRMHAIQDAILEDLWPLPAGGKK